MGHATDELRATEISKSFGALKVLDDITISVARGESVGLLGPNGAGKSTLLNIIAGYESADAGTVTLDESSLDGRSPTARAKHGLARTFQAGRLFDGLSVAENVAVGALGVGAATRDARQRTHDILRLLDLHDVAARPAAGLPHGVSRLVGLARAVAAHPTYLLMDEPAAGLNEHETPTLLAALESVRAEFGCGMLLIEHNVSLVAAACSRVAVLAAGRLIFEGEPRHALEDSAVRTAYLGDKATGDRATGDRATGGSASSEATA